MESDEIMLVTLGNVKLIDGVYGQAKGLLLLVYLILEGRQHRSRLARLFWPQSTRGRENLSALLYKINNVAQLSAFMESTKEYVSCTLPIDIEELDEALEQSNLEKVHQVYGGQFCQDLYVDSISEELEEWIYTTREHIAYRVHKLLLSNATHYARQGDWYQAAEYAQQSHQVVGLGALNPNELAYIYQLLQATNHHYSKVIVDMLRELGVTEISPRYMQNGFAEVPAVPASFISADTPYAHFIHNIYDLTQLASRSYRDNLSRHWLHKHKNMVYTLVLRENAWLYFLNDLQVYVTELHKDNSELSFVVFDCQYLNWQDYQQLHKILLVKRFFSEQGVAIILAAQGILESPLITIPEALRNDVYYDSDRALEYCEKYILQASNRKEAGLLPVALADFQLLSHLKTYEIDILHALCQSAHYAQGTFIIKMGDTDNNLYLLTQGIVDITLGDESSTYRRRINQQVAGSVFGELAFLNTTTRTANVEAVISCECLVLSKNALALLRVEHADLYHKLAQEFNEILIYRIKHLTNLH